MDINFTGQTAHGFGKVVQPGYEQLPPGAGWSRPPVFTNFTLQDGKLAITQSLGIGFENLWNQIVASMPTTTDVTYVNAIKASLENAFMYCGRAIATSSVRTTGPASI
jgi:hypothetical protein